MKRIVLVLALVLGLISLGPIQARATCSPLNLSAIANGLTADATPVTTAFNGLYTCVTTVDNSQIGVNGINASQIIPNSLGAAIFGSTYQFQFNNGLILDSGNDALSPVNIAGHSITQSANLITAKNYPSGSTMFQVGPTGNVTQLGALILGAPGGVFTSQVGLTNDNGATPGLNANVPTGSTNGFTISFGGSNAGSVVPFYTLTGAKLGTTGKTVFNIYGAFNAGSCNAFSTCPNTQAVTISGVSFTSATSYDCYSNSESEQGGLHPFYVALTATTGKIAYNNYTNGTLSGAGITQTSLFCVGT